MSAGAARPVRPVATLGAAMVVISSGMFVILPLLPDLQEANGLTTPQLGIVAGAPFVAGTALAGLAGLRVPFVVLALAVLAAVPVLWRLEPGHLPGPSPAPPTPVRALLARPAVRRATLLYVAMILPAGVYDVIWARFLTDLGAGRMLVGLSFTIYAIPYLAVALFGASLIDRLGPLRASWWGLLATLGPIVAYGLAESPTVLVGIATIEGVANALSIPAAQAVMVLACRPGEVGTGQGLAGAAGIGTAGVAAVGAAPLYAAFGAAATFWTTAVLMAVLGATAMWLGARPARPQPSLTAGR